MSRWLRQSTAVDVKVGPFVDQTDGFTAETALTLSQADIRLAKNNGNWAQKNDTNSATHEENGWYECALNTTDTDTAGILVLAVNESGALPVWVEFQVLPQVVYDALIAGSGNGIRADIITQTLTPLVANMTQISGDATAADNLETAFDDTAGPVSWLGIADQGTAQAATSTTIQLRSAATFADDTPIGMTVMAFGSTQGYWQSRVITDYVGSTDTATVDAWTVTPSGTITYKLFNTPPSPAGLPVPANVTQIAGAAVNVNTAQIGVNVVQVSGDSGAADNLEAEYDGTGFKSYLRRNTAQGGAAGSITLDAGASATDDFYNNTLVAIVSGAGAGQARFISDYTGSSRVATVSPNWVTNPDSSSVFVVHPFGSIPGASAPTAAEVADAVWDEDMTAHQTQGTAGQTLGDSGADTDTLYSLATAINADTDDIQGRLPAALVGGRISADVGSISGDAAAADNLEAEYDNTGFKSYTRRGTAQAGAANSITLDTGASSSDDYYNNEIVAIMAGAGVGQARFINDYTGSSRVAAVSPNWITNPDSSSVFVVLPFASIPGATAPTAAEVADAVWDEDMTAHQTQGSAGQTLGDSGADADSIWSLANANLDAAVSSRASATQATNIQTDVDDIQSRLPAALIGGRIDANVGAISGDVTAADNLESYTDGTTPQPVNATQISSSAATADAVETNIGNLDATVSSRSTLNAAAVNAEVVDALNVDTYAEPGQNAPAATASIVAKLGYLYKAWRNRATQSSSQYRLYNDDTTTIGQQATVTDDSTTFDRSEMGSG